MPDRQSVGAGGAHGSDPSRWSCRWASRPGRYRLNHGATSRCQRKGVALFATANSGLKGLRFSRCANLAARVGAVEKLR
ncbi:protein of unknown function [Burkholderia multivorans]